MTAVFTWRVNSRQKSKDDKAAALEKKRLEEEKKNDRYTDVELALRGILHKMIIEECQQYLMLGEISDEAFQDLHDSLYVPYQKLGGNGIVKEYMETVQELVVHPTRKRKD